MYCEHLHSSVQGVLVGHIGIYNCYTACSYDMYKGHQKSV